MHIDDFLPRNVVKLLIRIIITVVIVALIYRYFDHRTLSVDKTPGQNEETSPSEQGGTSPQLLPGKKQLDNTSKLPDNTDKKKPKLKELTPGEMKILEHEMLEWKTSRGYFEQNDIDQYANYDRETLIQLSKEGDLLALDMLADSLQNEGNHQKAKEVLEFAALHGSTSALTRLAASQNSMARKENITEVERKEAIRKMLVYSEFAALRGDRQGIWSSLMLLKTKNISLTEADINYGKKEAIAMYDLFEQQRLSINIGEFDNTTDQLYEINMDFMIKPLPNPNKWATDFIFQ